MLVKSASLAPSEMVRQRAGYVLTYALMSSERSSFLSSPCYGGNLGEHVGLLKEVASWRRIATKWDKHLCLCEKNMRKSWIGNIAGRLQWAALIITGAGIQPKGSGLLPSGAELKEQHTIAVPQRSYRHSALCVTLYVKSYPDA